VAALLVDMDGVLVARNKPIPGSAEALERLEHAGLPWLLATNTSLVTRAALAEGLARAGIKVPPERIVSALSASAAYTAHRHPGGRLYLLATADAGREFEGQQLLSAEEADAAPEGTVDAVVVGDAGDELSWRNLDRAFRLVRAGARLLAMHRNPWWLTQDGPRLDAGAAVAGLEFATGRRAIVLGKPSRAFFAEACRQLGHPAKAVAMVGDDVWNDVLGAQRAGLWGVFVRTGKHGQAELDQAAGDRRQPRAPDIVVDSLADLAGLVEAASGQA
jgi:HAD superfamily hydrolase (TIGR01458 family)